MAINRRFLARSAIQGAAWALAWRFFLAGFSVAVMNVALKVAWPEIAIMTEVLTGLASLWLLVRFVYPAMIHLHQHYWRVFDLSVPAEPALARDIVLQQWAYLGRDLTLPWRAIRG